MKAQRRKRLKPTETIAAEIRAELRRILEIRRDVYAPINSFEEVPASDVGAPRYYVLFDSHQRVRFSKGLQLGGIGLLTLPDERITSLYFAFAIAVWHLKDRVHQFSKATSATVDTRSATNSSQELRICSDLANWKKHGSHENRSGLHPYLSEVRFDTSRCGPIELYYDGTMKRKGLIVTEPVPIHFTVNVLTGEDRQVVGNAREIIDHAFETWIPLIDQLGLLSNASPESRALRSILMA